MSREGDSTNSLGSCSSCKEALPPRCGMLVGALTEKKLCDVPSGLPARSCSGNTQRNGGAAVSLLGNAGNAPERMQERESPCWGELRLSSQRPGAENIFLRASPYYNPCLAQRRTFRRPILGEEVFGFILLYFPVSLGTLGLSRSPLPLPAVVQPAGARRSRHHTPPAPTGSALAAAEKRRVRPVLFVAGPAAGARTRLPRGPPLAVPRSAPWPSTSAPRQEPGPPTRPVRAGGAGRGGAGRGGGSRAAGSTSPPSSGQ